MPHARVTPLSPLSTVDRRCTPPLLELSMPRTIPSPPPPPPVPEARARLLRLWQGQIALPLGRPVGCPARHPRVAPHHRRGERGHHVCAAGRGASSSRDQGPPRGPLAVQLGLHADLWVEGVAWGGWPPRRGARRRSDPAVLASLGCVSCQRGGVARAPGAAPHALARSHGPRRPDRRPSETVIPMKAARMARVGAAAGAVAALETVSPQAAETAAAQGHVGIPDSSALTK